MSVYAITGNLASGKSAVLDLLRKKGAFVYDIDKEVHRYYSNKDSNVYKEVVKLFPEVVDNRGAIIRRRLGDIVFMDKAKLAKLEEIVHPIVIADLLVWVNKVKKSNGIFAAEVPLLFEKKLEDNFSGVIFVYVEKEILLKRICDTKKTTVEEANRRLALYLPTKFKVSKSDFILDNSSTFADLNNNVDKLWKELK